MRHRFLEYIKIIFWVYVVVASIPFASGCNAGYRYHWYYGCLICGAGTYSPGGYPDSCTNCPSGTYCNSNGCRSCTSCSPGTYNPYTGERSCYNCPSGTYSSGYGLESCSNCLDGQVQPSSGQSSCTSCPAGTYAHSDNINCIDCLAGTFSVGGTNSCSNCPSGTYAVNSGSSSCSSCPAGQIQPNTGQASCTSCSAGTYADSHDLNCIDCLAGTSSAGNVDSCTNCNNGQYQESPGQPSCIDCVAGTYTPNDGATYTSCFICGYGFYTPLASGRYNSCVACSDGTYTDENNPAQCIPQCGDGKKAGNEACDDGNTSPNDGCNSDCSKVEDSWTCTGGSATTQDNCIFHLNESIYGPTYESTLSITIAQTVVGISVFAGYLIALICNTSAQDAWAVIHFLQLVLILPLIALTMSIKVKEFIASNAFFALSIYSLPSKAIKSIPLIKDLSFYQPDEYLRMLGWASGSTLVNNFLLLILLFVLSLVNLLFCLLYSSTKNKDNKLSLIVLKVYRMFSYSIYIRIFIEVFIFTVIMLFSEIKYYIKNGGDDDFEHQKQSEYEKVKGNLMSSSLSCVLLVLTLFLLLLVFISWKKDTDKMKIEETCKTRELYNGILKVPNSYVYQQKQEAGKDETQELGMKIHLPTRIKAARLYSLLFLVKRLVLVLIVVLTSSSDSLFGVKICFLSILQTVYIIYAIFVRSFASIKDQVIEATNEIVFFILILLLVIYDSNTKWTDTAKNLYIYIILSHILILFIVSITSGSIKLFILIKSCRESNLNETMSENAPNCQMNNLEEFNVTKLQLNQTNHCGNAIIQAANPLQDFNEEDKMESNKIGDKSLA